MRFRLSFQGLILTGCVAVVLCTLAFVGILLENFLRDRMVGQLRDSLFHQVVLLSEVASDRWVPGDSVEEIDRLAVLLGNRLGMRVTLISPDGLVLGDTEVSTEEVGRMENHSDRPEVIEALSTGKGWAIRRSATLGVDFLYVAGVLGRVGEAKLVIRLALSLAEMEKSLADQRRLILWSSLLGVLLSLGLSILVARYISLPVNRLTNTATNILSGDRPQRVRRYPNHEIGDLGRVFDKMADHLQEEISAVTRARDRLETILRGMVEGVLVTDHTGSISLANRALRELLSLDINPLGRMPSEIIRHADLIEAINQVSRGLAHTSMEIRTLGPPARTLEVEMAALPTETQRSGVVAVFHDITERKRIEEMRRDFVANVSHELRTPLTAIRGSVETLLDGPVDNPQFTRRFTEMIERQVRRFEAIVMDLLELAKIESGDISLNYEEISAEKLAETVRESISDLAAERNVALNFELPPHPLVFRGDRRQVEQAILNLMDNAVKYTQEGGQVQFKVFLANNMVHLAVRDTGPGIHPEHLPRIFERFYRVDRNRSRELGGTGLGLSIVKHIVQAHKGRVEVDSFPGRGSTFTIILPV